MPVLRPLLDSRDPAAGRGRARSLLGLNAALHRSVISRWSRGRPAWSPADGLIKTSPGTQAALDAHRLGRRAYSLSALQRFAACPYQFLLATIYRLEPWDEPEPLVRMDPLTRGSLFHAIQAAFYREMEAKNALPVVRARLNEAIAGLDAVVDRIAAEYEEKLAPAIPRVWRDEVGELRRDLGIWVQKMTDGDTWQPAYFEFSFGLHDEGRDPRSLPDPVIVDGRFVLRGSVDLIERRADLDVLRVTDHKTGRNRSNPDLIVGGGATLQPVLYSVAIEQGLHKRVTEGRLYYATTAGGFADHAIPINDYTRGQGLQVLTVIDRSVEHGFLAAAPGERGVYLVRFPPRLWPTRGGARRTQGEGSTDRPRGAEGDAMTADAMPIDAEARRAIADDLDDTLIVEAAAGTGKTTELVNRILRVLETGRARMIEIVAVTFTEKAAGELKLRLREKLEERRANAAEDVAERLDLALETLEEAHVNTIHGFCAELLRERPVEARVDPLFVVLTEPQTDRLYSRAFRLWLQEALAHPPEGVRRALRRTSAPSFGGPADAGPIDRLRGAGRLLAEWRDFPAPWSRPPFDRDRELERLTELLHGFAELTAAPSSTRDNLFVDTDAGRRLSHQIALEQSFGQRDLDGWEARLIDLSRDRKFSRVRKGSGYRNSA